MRILLWEESRLIGDALRERLAREPDFEVTAVWSDGSALRPSVLEPPPDVAVLDSEADPRGPSRAAEMVKSRAPKTRVVLLFGRIVERDLHAARRLGVEAMLSKREPLELLVEAIRLVAGGATYVSPAIAEHLARLSDAEPSHRGRLDLLTERELDVLRLLAQGYRKRDVAAILHVSPKTIEGHADKIMKKLDLHDRVALARFAIREGLVEP